MVRTASTLAAGLLLALAAGAAHAQTPAPATPEIAMPASKKWNCFSGKVITIGVFGNGTAATLEFTVDPGPGGSYGQFQNGPAAPEVFASWSEMLTQAYIQNAIVTVQYGESPPKQPQKIVQVYLSRTAMPSCTYRSPLPPIVSLQPTLR